MAIQRDSVLVMPMLLVCLILGFSPNSTRAAVFTAGTGGTHATLTTAWNTAVATTGSAHEIRIRAGTYAERPNLGLFVAKTMTVTGGWNAGFTTSSDDPALTTFDAAGLGRGLGLNASDGVLLI